jgi:RNA polymerase sigma-70 factor (ECF subfamily)
MAEDEALMQRVAEGDHAAFAALVERHLDRAVALAQRITGNRSDAEELAQEAFLRVWVNAPRWRPEGALFRTWLTRVLVNLCIDRRRRPAFSPLEAAGDPADERTDALDALAARQSAAHVQAAIGELPARQRAALVLCYFEGLSNIEAAAALETSIGALESLLVRARRTLGARLAPILGPGGGQA